ncbi:hypothetical protein RJ641_009829 [Dillenia turbinata]|uniref:Uncharacterized protein n=1 Tax=Dillenia turbinata TaxID=194707 RepID=A0AAN8V2F1_9MAGN
MPLPSLAVDALGVVTIALVSLSVLLGLFCILYTLYFRSRVLRCGFVQLGYFNGPWIVRITFILFGIWWGFGEIVRLNLLRQEGRILNALGLKWQESLCKYYIVSNLGFAEPCLFLTLSFLLRASLQWRGSGILTQKWNKKTTGYVLVYCLPVFVFDLLLVLIGPKYQHGNDKSKLPKYFTNAIMLWRHEDKQAIALCTYPLLSTILHGLFATLLTAYLLLLGKQMVSSVINKGLQRRVYMLIFLVSSFLPCRVLLLGFSVLSKPEHFLFEALAFAGFLVLLACVIVGYFMLVYLPVADSLALRKGLRDFEMGEGRSGFLIDDHQDTASLIAANQSPLETSTATSLGRISDASTKRGSISFRTMIKDEGSSADIFEEEPTLFSSSTIRLLSPSPPDTPARIPQFET